MYTNQFNKLSLRKKSLIPYQEQGNPPLGLHRFVGHFQRNNSRKGYKHPIISRLLGIRLQIHSRETPPQWYGEKAILSILK